MAVYTKFFPNKGTARAQHFHRDLAKWTRQNVEHTHFSNERFLEEHTNKTEFIIPTKANDFE